MVNILKILLDNVLILSYLFFTDGSSYKRGDVTNLIFYCKEDGTKVQYYDKIVASTHINKLLFQCHKFWPCGCFFISSFLSFFDDVCQREKKIKKIKIVTCKNDKQKNKIYIRERQIDRFFTSLQEPQGVAVCLFL